MKRNRQEKRRPNLYHTMNQFIEKTKKRLSLWRIV